MSYYPIKCIMFELTLGNFTASTSTISDKYQVDGCSCTIVEG